MTFDEIEECFPEGALSDPATGMTLVSAQWLHDFAHAVAAKEREACAKLCDDADKSTHPAELADRIRARSGGAT